jgi:hypothetical protein
MRLALTRLMIACLPALLLAAGVIVWTGAQAGESANHLDGAQAAPCHEQAESGTAPARDPGGREHGCPDCRCLFASCNASVALPGMTTEAPVAFTLIPPLALAPARLVTQTLTGPPAEPPRL